MLEIGAEVDPEVEAAFERWCEDQRSALLALPGSVAARHFVRYAAHAGAGENPKYMALFELEAASALAPQVDADRDPPLPAALSGRVHSRRALYREIGASPQRRSPPTGAAILHVTVDVAPGYRDAFLAWYAGVHVPAVLGAPGMLGARRFERVALAARPARRAAHHSYCTLYEMEDARVIDRPELALAASRGACPAELAPHRVACHQVYEEIGRAPAR